MNHKPALKFAGSFMQIPDSASLRFGTGDFAIVAVLEQRDPPSGSFDTLFDNGGGLALRIDDSRPAFPVAWVAAEKILADCVLDPQTLHVIALYQHGDSVEIRLDGTRLNVVTEEVTPDSGTNANNLQIGPLYGIMPELLAISGPLSVTDLAGVERYLLDKYNGPEQPAPAVQPSTVDDLALWLEADHGVQFSDPSSKQVKGWLDQSPSHNNAIQATVADMPEWDATAFQGKPALKFA